MLVKFTYMDATQNVITADLPVQPVAEHFEVPADIYRLMLSDGYRCVGKVYIGEAVPIGYVFERREKYVDTEETFIAHVWVEFHAKEPENNIKYHYLPLGGKI